MVSDSDCVDNMFTCYGPYTRGLRLSSSSETTIASKTLAPSASLGKYKIRKFAERKLLDFRVFVLNFALKFAPNFPWNFEDLLCFVSREMGPLKFTKNQRRFSMANLQAIHRNTVKTTSETISILALDE